MIKRWGLRLLMAVSNGSSSWSAIDCETIAPDEGSDFSQRTEVARMLQGLIRRIREELNHDDSA